MMYKVIKTEAETEQELQLGDILEPVDCKGVFQNRRTGARLYFSVEQNGVKRNHPRCFPDFFELIKEENHDQ